MGESTDLNKPRLALKNPFGARIAAPDGVVAGGRLRLGRGRSETQVQFVEVTHELESLLNQVFEGRQEELLGLLDL